MHFFKKSIKSKLWLTIVFLVLIILVIIWLFQVFFLKSFYISERTNTLKKTGQQIITLIKKENKLELTQDTKNELVALSDPSTYGSVAIINKENELLDLIYLKELQTKHNPRFENNLRNRYIRWLAEDQELVFNLNRQEPFTLKTEKKIRPYVIVGIPIIKENSFMGTLILESPLEPIEETVAILKKQLTFIFLISLLIGTILALILSRNFTKPILQITQAAQKIATGDFDTTIKINSDDEIGTLGEIINDLPRQLEKSEKFRRDFIANTTHELKTPISLIHAYAELIRDIEGDNKEIRDKHLQVIMEEAARLNHVVEEILFLSQIETSGNLKPVKFNVLDLLEDVTGRLDFLAKQKLVTITFNIEDVNIEVFADKEKMYQVFYNVINNAIMYSQEKSQVIINLQKNLRIEIIDFGIGISEGDLPYVWDRFYKVDKSRSNNTNSTGLGLAIVKSILQAHGFAYGLESKLGKGTLFWIEMKSKTG